MAVDLRSVTRAAAEAALGDVAPKKGLSPWRALAIGAGLVTAGRIATGPGGRFVRELVQGHSSNGSAEDEEPEAEQDEEAEAEQDEEPDAEAHDEEPEAEADDEPEAEQHEEPEAEADDELEAIADDDKPEAEADDDDSEAEAEPDAEQHKRTEGEAEGDRPGSPHHPLFEQALAPEAAQRRDSESPKSRTPKGRRTAPPRRPRRPRTPAQGA